MKKKDKRLFSGFEVRFNEFGMHFNGFVLHGTTQRMLPGFLGIPYRDDNQKLWNV